MTGAKRKTESGYARGEETRTRIIQVALALFGEHGFDGVSTRDIAAQAGVPAPSLQYYFDNKEGLYAACIADIQASAMNAVGPALDNLERLLASEASDSQLIDGHCAVLESFADFLFASPDAARRALFIKRRIMPMKSALMPKEQWAKGPGARLHNCCIGVIARLSGGSTSEEESRMTAVAINGQLLTFHFSRDHLDYVLGYDEITGDRLAMLKRIVRRQTTLVFKALKRPAKPRR